jgi:hypothetical protein
MLMSRQENAGQNYDTKTVHKSFESVEMFTNLHLGMRVTTQTYIHKKLRSCLILEMLATTHFIHVCYIEMSSLSSS